jgi:hypothetical protein
MVDADITDEFRRLWSVRDACREAALAISSPNPEDDDLVKLAIVGFSYHQKTEDWRREHWREAKDLLDEFDETDASAAAKEFAMLAFGALLGLRSSGQLDDRGLSLGCAVLPGFIALKAV